MKKAIFLLAMILLIVPSIGGLAQSDDGSATYPFPCTEDGSNGIQCGTEQDNECFPGGQWDGACDENEIQWACGWYLARYVQGYIDYEGIPEWCKIPAPPQPEPIVQGNGKPAGGGGPVCAPGPVVGGACILGSNCYRVFSLDDRDGDGCVNDEGYTNLLCNVGSCGTYPECAGAPSCRN